MCIRAGKSGFNGRNTSEKAAKFNSLFVPLTKCFLRGTDTPKHFFWQQLKKQTKHCALFLMIFFAYLFFLVTSHLVLEQQILTTFSPGSPFLYSLCAALSLCSHIYIYSTDDDDVNDDARVSEDTILCSFGAPVLFSI